MKAVTVLIIAFASVMFAQQQPSTEAGQPKPKEKTGQIKAGKQYTSGKGTFSITVPPGNWAVDTYKFKAGQLKQDNYDYEEVVFYIPDFGQAYAAGVHRIPQATLAEMAKEEEKQTLSNLANKALHLWRTGYAEEPQPVEENAVQRQFGGGLLRIYLAKRSSMIVRMVGGKGEPIDTPIAVLVFKKGDLFIYAAVEDDDLQTQSPGQSSADPNSILSKNLQSFFASMTVKFPAQEQLRNQPSQQKPSDAQGRVTRLVEGFEAAESGHGVNAREEEMKKGIEQADADMKVLLVERPDDPDLLVLSVRLERFHGRGVEMVSGKNAEAELDQSAQASRARTDGLAARLDRALVLQPNRADAYYWKARLYGMKQPVVRNGVFDYITLDLQESIRSGRRAVELAPDNAGYREALANYLLMDGKQDEAGEVMHTVAGGRHIISLLLADSKAVPLPSGAILDSSGSARFGEYEINTGRIHDYPTLRVHTYIIYKPLSEVLAFYRERWPGFQFFKSEDDAVKTKDMEMQVWAQELRGPVNALSPVASKSDWDREAKDSELKPPNTDGPILFALTEIHRKSADAPKTLNMLTGDVPLQDITCLLTILDQREPGH
jgi:tetratricopeptide (TPR) repeat protein